MNPHATPRNYARNLQTNRYVFFEIDSPPDEVKARPEQWVLWHRPFSTIHFQLIGESKLEYCSSFKHYPKVCSYCKASKKTAI